MKPFIWKSTHLTNMNKGIHSAVFYRVLAGLVNRLNVMLSSQDLQIISTDDNQVVAAVQDWHQNDSYNLYMSDARGLFFTLALEDVVSSGGPEDNVMIELYEVLK